MIFLPLLISLAFAAEPSAPVFNALEQAPAKQPLGGSFEQGEKMLRSGDPEAEANTVFNERGVSKIVVCGFACLAPGVDAKAMNGVKGPTIPATSDTVNEKSKGYNEAAMDFASRFNKQMIARKALDPAGGSHEAKSSYVIQSDVSAKDLTMNGVTIGKSNLYNSVGRFGTNMFHKKDENGKPLFIVCWKGDDGTTLAYESGETGGRDQTITGAHLFASGVDYRFAADCKTSKKVSSSLSLAGVKLGEATAEVEKSLGAPSERETGRLIWRHAVSKKRATLKTDIEVSTADDKVNSISVNRGE